MKCRVWYCNRYLSRNLNTTKNFTKEFGGRGRRKERESAHLLNNTIVHSPLLSLGYCNLLWWFSVVQMVTMRVSSEFGPRPLLFSISTFSLDDHLGSWLDESFRSPFPSPFEYSSLQCLLASLISSHLGIHNSKLTIQTEL